MTPKERQNHYLDKISDIIDRPIATEEYPKLCFVIKKYSDEILDKSLEVSKNAVTTNFIKYFMGVASRLNNKETVSNMLKDI